MEDLLKVGVITTTHGVRGEVKVFPTTDDAERFLDIEYVLLDTGKELRRLNIQNVKFFKNLAILKFEGIDNINDIRRETTAWQEYRNKHKSNVNWQFTADDARTKLARLYPSIDA